MDASTNVWSVSAPRGNGSFLSPPTWITSPNLGRLLQTRDFDGDGRVDLAGAVYGSKEAHILRNTCPFFLTHTATPNPGLSGEAMSYRFRVYNLGEQPVGALQWSLSAPPEINPLSATPTQGTCSTQTSCSLGALQPFQSVQIDVDASLAASFVGDTGPTATVSDATIGSYSWKARHWAAPLIADVNSDGAPDLIGEWETPPLGSSRLAMLLNKDVPATKLGVFVDGYWFLDRNGDYDFDPATEVHGWGSPGAVPVRGDWDGDGDLDLGVFHDGQWFLDRNGDGAFDPATEAIGWGLPGWTPAQGLWR